MKKLILTLALVFAAGLFSTTALALTSNTDNITVVKGDKDKKKKETRKERKARRAGKEVKSCSSETGEKKSCCSHGTETPAKK